MAGRPWSLTPRAWSVRTRVVSLMLVLMAAAFVISGAVLYVVSTTRRLRQRHPRRRLPTTTIEGWPDAAVR